jgi:hypothetical protein
MPRTVTALFETRDEAEVARISLASDVKVTSARVLGKDTAAALNGLSMDAKYRGTVRDALQGGAHLLVATVDRGQEPRRIVDTLLKGRAIAPVRQEDRSSFGIDTDVATPVTEPHPAAETLAPAAPVEPTPVARSPEPLPAAQDQGRPAMESVPEARTPSAPDPVPEARQPAAADEQFESRAPARRLTQEEVEAGGLLRDRVIEVVEMREEPVISREVVVREEVIVRKNDSQRTDAEVERLG